MLTKKNTFKAAVLTKIDNPLKIIEISKPNKLKQGQILVKLKSSSICGAQANEINGIKGPDKYLPHMMGHEGYGIVTNIGPKVKKVKKGSHVILHWRKGRGIEADGAIYYSKKIGKVNSGKVTTFSEYSIVSENRVTAIKLPKKIEKIAPCFGCSLSTAYGLVFKETKMKASDKILIMGCGGLGMSIAAMARTAGIKDITFFDQNFNKFKSKFINSLKLSKKNKITSKLLLSKTSKQFNHVIDTTGNTKLIKLGFNLLDKDSNLILVGQPKINKSLTIFNPLKIFNGIKIFASDGGQIDPSKDLYKISSHVVNNFNFFKNFISHNFYLKEINKGFKLLKKGNALRIGIKF